MTTDEVIRAQIATLESELRQAREELLRTKRGLKHKAEWGFVIIGALTLGVLIAAVANNPREKIISCFLQ